MRFMGAVFASDPACECGVDSVPPTGLEFFFAMVVTGFLVFGGIWYLFHERRQRKPRIGKVKEMGFYRAAYQTKASNTVNRPIVTMTAGTGAKSRVFFIPGMRTPDDTRLQFEPRMFHHDGKNINRIRIPDPNFCYLDEQQKVAFPETFHMVMADNPGVPVFDAAAWRHVKDPHRMWLRYFAAYDKKLPRQLRREGWRRLKNTSDSPHRGRLTMGTPAPYDRFAVIVNRRKKTAAAALFRADRVSGEVEVIEGVSGVLRLIGAAPGARRRRLAAKLRFMLGGETVSQAKASNEKTVEFSR